MANTTDWHQQLKPYAAQQTTVLVCDQHVLRYHGRLLRQYLASISQTHHCIVIPAGETHKTRATQQYIENHLLNWRCGRDTRLIALGGGVTLDMVGFVAAYYHRGIPVIYIPSTLLAMVDASIGGKTAINTHHGKNTLGCFYTPTDTIIAPEILITLPAHHWYEGLAEMLKHGLVGDRHHFHACQHLLQQNTLTTSAQMTELIDQSRAIKTHIVHQDPREQGLRHVLNFGHSIGHAIESASCHAISHGHAVAIGMIAECKLSLMMGLLDHHSYQYITERLWRMPIPWHQLSECNPTQLMSYWLQDKKNRHQQAHSVLLTSIGHPYQQQQRYAHPIPITTANACLQWLCQQRLETACTSPQ
jgi:3-dehydroquinate synthase